MGNVSIRKIDMNNIDDVKKIQVKESQRTFIETVEECLKEAKIHNEWQPVAIYAEDKLVGFAMYGAFGKNPDVWIDRIIIDAKYQSNGFGKSAMEQLMKKVLNQYSVKSIYLSFTEGNHIAKKNL